MAVTIYYHQITLFSQVPSVGKPKQMGNKQYRHETRQELTDSILCRLTSFEVECTVVCREGRKEEATHKAQQSLGL